MHLSDFDYSLPPSSIAQSPIFPRDHSKLLVLDKHTWNREDKHFYDLEDMLWENDVLVINKTSVIPARLFGEIDIFPKWKKEIKKVEIFLHKQIGAHTWECLWYPGKNLKIGRTLRFFDDTWEIVLQGMIEKVSDMGRYIRFDRSWVDFLDTIQKIGEIPLPPYITQKLENISDYQTVYATESGSAAAPTAWLHFTKELLEKLQQKWVIIEEVLLHVWVGTFKPVETENIKEHYMHSEYIELQDEVASRLNTYKKEGKHIIAVGTTSVRVLESFSDEKWVLHPGKKETDIFIYPGYTWRFVKNLITNFHLPKSTLLMLVSSLWWREHVLEAYKYAVENNYRFFSFGDAMMVRGE